MQNAWKNMIEGQIRPNGINDKRLIETVEKIDKADFYPGDEKYKAYIDTTIFLNELIINSESKQEITDEHKQPPYHNRFIPSSLTLCKMIQALHITPRDNVLNIGCATGYSTAILAFLAHRVTGIESNKQLAEIAEATLKDKQIYNTATINQGDMMMGYAENAPYNAILINGATNSIPDSLLNQLHENGGRLIAPTIIAGNMSAVNIYVNTRGKITKERIFDINIPPLIE